MGERTEPIRQDIDATRSSINETLEQIEGQVREKVDTTVSQARKIFDVRSQFNDRPWITFGAAVAVGYALGAMGGDGDDDHDDYEPRSYRRGEPMRYYYEGRTSSRSYERSRPERYEPQHEGRPASGNGMGSTVAQFTDPLRHELSLMSMAAMRSVMNALRDTLRQSLPQFDQEYKTVKHEREEQGQERARAVGESSSLYGTAPGAAQPGTMPHDISGQTW